MVRWELMVLISAILHHLRGRMSFANYVMKLNVMQPSYHVVMSQPVSNVPLAANNAQSAEWNIMTS